LRERRARRVDFPQRPADHHLDDLDVGGGPHLDGTHIRPVAEDRGLVAEGAHLLHPVGDEDDRHPLVAKAADDREDLPHLPLGQRRGRFVQDQHIWPSPDCLRDLDNLALGKRQVADDGARVDAAEA
jgi:hypothetical protein